MMFSRRHVSVDVDRSKEEGSVNLGAGKLKFTIRVKSLLLPK